jgi:hypothetical protein
VEESGRYRWFVVDFDSSHAKILLDQLTESSSDILNLRKTSYFDGFLDQIDPQWEETA